MLFHFTLLMTLLNKCRFRFLKIVIHNLKGSIVAMFAITGLQNVFIQNAQVCSLCDLFPYHNSHVCSLVAFIKPKAEDVRIAAILLFYIS
jgi:hypothetical protein